MPLYNSALETGIRAVIVLEHLRPVKLDLAEMVLFDHVVVHSGDHGGPKSLHAEVPGRRGELLIRRRLVEYGLKLMARCHLVVSCNDADGIAYQATDNAAAYVDLLETRYSERLKESAAWLGGEVRRHTKRGFKDKVRASVGDWAESFGRSDDDARPV